MKLNDYNCLELSSEDILEIEGGFIPLLVIGAVLLLSSCQGSKNSGSGSQINIQCTNFTIIQKGDTIKIAPK